MSLSAQQIEILIISKKSLGRNVRKILKNRRVAKPSFTPKERIIERKMERQGFEGKAGSKTQFLRN